MDLIRAFEFDAAHRVMNERVKCYNLHGHRFKVEAKFNFEEVNSLGYAVDFKEIKRVLFDYLDKKLDHAGIFNPLDTELIDLCTKEGWRLWTMGLGRNDDVNPSAENIASEIFVISQLFFNHEKHGISISRIRLYETPNCWVDCTEPLYMPTTEKLAEINKDRETYSDFEYDARKV